MILEKSILGESAALATAVCWTITAIAFEFAGKKVGSLPVNLIRLIFAFFIIGIFSYFRKGLFFASDASLEAWIWLPISGIIGFVIGDLLLFQAFVVIGARVSMLIMALTPPIAAFFGWLILNEHMSAINFIGMAVTISGIAMVILAKEHSKGPIKMKYPVKGVLLAFGGAVGQGLGLVFSKLGMKDYDPFLATQIRILAGIAGFSVLFFALNKWKNVFAAFRDKKAMTSISIGSVFGPFLGVSLSLLSIQHTTTGIASTIMAIVPVLIIIPSVVVFKERITPKEITGAVIAFVGVVMFFVF
ncbi:DMT family transporter [Plebeiibacterium marinum]|uniref:DMT family transporter n=1 Tax=Plebeiibacterium marinum TaxID=2992111 RepID=A0AAE3SK10_9BACT|nr:DMT family transporter [Plebeiobacterium marinum]MCW3806137.1 DMT family transporter [Plebeiobacterium marinum]